MHVIEFLCSNKLKNVIVVNQNHAWRNGNSFFSVFLDVSS